MSFAMVMVITPFLLLIRYTHLSRLSGNVNSFLDQFQNQFQGLLCEKFHNVWGGAAGDGGLKNLKKIPASSVILLAGKKLGTGISAYIGCNGEEYDHGENW